MMFYVEVFQAHHPLSMLIRFFPRIGTAKRRAESSDLNLQLRDLRDMKLDPMVIPCDNSGLGRTRTTCKIQKWKTWLWRVDGPIVHSVQRGLMPNLLRWIDSLKSGRMWPCQMPGKHDKAAWIVPLGQHKIIQRVALLRESCHTYHTLCPAALPWCNSVPTAIFGSTTAAGVGTLFNPRSDQPLSASPVTPGASHPWCGGLKKGFFVDGFLLKLKKLLNSESTGFFWKPNLPRWIGGILQAKDTASVTSWQPAVTVSVASLSIPGRNLSTIIEFGGWPTPLKNDGVRQLGWWHSQLNGKIKNVPNHQPDIVYPKIQRLIIIFPTEWPTHAIFWAIPNHTQLVPLAAWWFWS